MPISAGFDRRFGSLRRQQTISRSLILLRNNPLGLAPVLCLISDLVREPGLEHDTPIRSYENDCETTVEQRTRLPLGPLFASFLPIHVLATSTESLG